MTLAALLADAVATAPSDDHGPWLFWLISGKNPFWQNSGDASWLNYHHWVQKENWEAFLRGMRVTLSMLGAALLMYKARALRMGQPVPRKWARNVAILFTVLGFGVYFDYFNPNTRYSEYYHRHEFYHYYLGSKFFREIGYKRLYECTAIAEIELGRGANVRKRDIRDLRVNLIKPIIDTEVVKDPKHCTAHFSPERWAAFKKDVDWFYKSAAGSYWENMIKDHGYNPPPVWSMTGKFFADMGVADDAFFKYLASIDILLHLGAVTLLVWAFGWETAAVGVIFWGCNRAADFYWTGGAFLRQDWWFFLVAALCLTKKKYFFLAGFALMWSALLRIFPAIFFGGWAIAILIHVALRVRGVRKAENGKEGFVNWLEPRHWRLIGGAVLALLLLVPASMVVTRAPGEPIYGAYVGFYNHTLKGLQNTALTNHMGLESVMVHNWDSRMRFLRNDNQDDPFEGWKVNRSTRFKQMKPIYLVILAGLAAWTAWALRRTKLLWLGLPLSLPLVCALSNMTCYYYSLFITLCALVHVRKELGPPMLAVGGVSAFMLWSPTGYYWVDDRFVAQAYLFIGLSLMGLWIYSRPFSLARLKAWWSGKPEPRARAAAPLTGSSTAAAK
jgi:hypothetical protein